MNRDMLEWMEAEMIITECKCECGCKEPTECFEEQRHNCQCWRCHYEHR